jgi:hypothetical protein
LNLDTAEVSGPGCFSHVFAFPLAASLLYLLPTRIKASFFFSFSAAYKATKQVIPLQHKTGHETNTEISMQCDSDLSTAFAGDEKPENVQIHTVISFAGPGTRCWDRACLGPSDQCSIEEVVVGSAPRRRDGGAASISWVLLLLS